MYRKNEKTFIFGGVLLQLDVSNKTYSNSLQILFKSDLIDFVQ